MHVHRLPESSRSDVVRIPLIACATSLGGKALGVTQPIPDVEPDVQAEDRRSSYT